MLKKTINRCLSAFAVTAFLLLSACSQPAYIQRNDLLVADGRLEEAAEDYRQLISENPEESELYYQLAKVLYSAEDYQQAAAAIDKAIIIERLLARYQLLAGKIRFADNSYFDALNHLTNAVTLDTQLLEAYYFLGLAYNKTGQADKALEQFKTALAIEPLYFDARLAWVDISFREAVKSVISSASGQLSETSEKTVKSLAETLESALVIRPASVKGHLLLSEIYASLGTELKARAVLEERIAEFGPDDSILVALAKLEYISGRYERSLELIDQLVKPDLQSRLLNLRIALRTGSKPAEREIAEMLHRHPGSAELQLLAGQQELQKGNIGKAERLVQKSLEISPDYAEAYLTLSRIQDAQGDSTGSGWSLGKSLRLAPGNLEIRLAWLHNLLEQGRWTEASKQLVRFGLDASHPEVAYINGLIAVEKGDDRTAEKLFEEIAATQYSVRTEVRLAEIEIRRSRYEGAEKRLNRAAEFFPNNLEIALAKANLMMRAQRSAEIPNLLAPHLAAKQGRGRVHLVLAESQVQQGQTTAALNTLEQAVRHWPDNPDLVQAYTLYLGISNRHLEAIPLLEDMQRFDHKYSRLFYFRLREYYFMAGNKTRFQKYYQIYQLENNRVKLLK